MTNSALKPLLISSLIFALIPRSFAGPAPTALTEDFKDDPAAHWKVHGEVSLFRWKAADQNLEVTWDSSKSNSFFALPLGQPLTRSNDFIAAFDLRLMDVAIGATPGKPFTFELAAGFLNWSDSTASNFLRGTGFNSPNLLEFDYFPDSGFGATIAPTIISSNGIFASSFNAPLELAPGHLYRVQLRFESAQNTLLTSVTRDGEPMGPIKSVALGPDFTDFQLDHFAIMSYHDGGQDPQFSGSILAHGIVDNVFLALGPTATLDLRLAGQFVGGQWEAGFIGQAGWFYELQRTTDFITWSSVTAQTIVSSGPVVFIETNRPSGSNHFYRILGRWVGAEEK